MSRRAVQGCPGMATNRKMWRLSKRTEKKSILSSYANASALVVVNPKCSDDSSPTSGFVIDLPSASRELSDILVATNVFGWWPGSNASGAKT
jgi:hypothetical protein